MQIKDKVVILTGGANGIGAALARRLVLEGNKTNAIFVFCDTTNFDLLHQLIDTAQNTFGDCINNAGIGQIDEFYDQTDSWIKIIDVNLNAVIKGSQLGIEFLKKTWWWFSLVGFYPLKLFPVSCTSKYGVIGFTQSLRDLNNTDKIRVNAVAPGFVVVNAFIKIIKDDKLLVDTILIPKENLSQIISKSFL
ncbi:hypothetical protein C2G38_2205464 [Gigaspora rosea]|uniref:Uncharacterized protein n=1 Tax=Gigaspora rosea TaxID=44941 RepID=A0A397UN69_9GLOM|nr:hypothetical protein C2G38_2205464 [Gigaspora rosea]